MYWKRRERGAGVSFYTFWGGGVELLFLFHKPSVGVMREVEAREKLQRSLKFNINGAYSGRKVGEEYS